MPETDIDTEQSGISWTERTWNPWMGCTKVSPGCAHCYMFRDQARYGNDPSTIRRSKTKFDYPLKLDGSHLIFTCSWSDWFHEAADAWREEAWDVIRASPQHTFQILTKRPELVADRLPADWGDGWPNVWLGVSVENARHSFRADLLREIPAALRFISAEPLLGSLYTPFNVPMPNPRDPTIPGYTTKRAPLDLTGFGWIIVGGESGAKADARPMHPAWAREIRDHVQLLEVETGARPALHMKQWGSWTPDIYGRDRDGIWLYSDGSQKPYRLRDLDPKDCEAERDRGGVRVRYAGPLPGAGGKFLDGTDWCEIPERAAPEPPGQLTLA